MMLIWSLCYLIEVSVLSYLPPIVLQCKFPLSVEISLQRSGDRDAQQSPSSKCLLAVEGDCYLVSSV